jgi:hypothetical protein
MEQLLCDDSALPAAGLEITDIGIKKESTKQHNGDSPIHVVKCWGIPQCVKEHIGKSLYTCWKVLGNSTVRTGMCWKCPLSL